MPTKKKATTKAPKIEQALTDLEKLVEKMEKGNLALEESLDYFEEGINLTKVCQKQLQEAEQRVQILLKKNGDLQLEDFE